MNDSVRVGLTGGHPEATDRVVAKPVALSAVAVGFESPPCVARSRRVWRHSSEKTKFLRRKDTVEGDWPAEFADL